MKGKEKNHVRCSLLWLARKKISGLPGTRQFCAEGTRVHHQPFCVNYLKKNNTANPHYPPPPLLHISAPTKLVPRLIGKNFDIARLLVYLSRSFLQNKENDI